MGVRAQPVSLRNRSMTLRRTDAANVEQRILRGQSVQPLRRKRPALAGRAHRERKGVFTGREGNGYKFHFCKVEGLGEQKVSNGREIAANQTP